MMLPIVTLMADGKEHTSRELCDTLAVKFQLTEADRTELLPSGRQSRFSNRVTWAIVHLRKAGLLQSIAHGKNTITQRGKDELSKRPDAINIKLLKLFPEYVEFISGSSQGPELPEPKEPPQPPEEALESSYQSLRLALAQELLDRVKQASPQFFEQLVIDLLVAMGYGGSLKDAGEAVGRRGDGGIDGIIKEDKLGLDAIYVQAKRWDGTVGRPDVQAFAGSIMGQRANKGVFITTSQFTKDAKDYVGRIEKKIVLIDGEQLTQLMIDYGIAVTEVASYTIKRIDQDYFSEE